MVMIIRVAEGRKGRRSARNLVNLLSQHILATVGSGPMHGINLEDALLPPWPPQVGKMMLYGPTSMYVHIPEA